MRILALDLGKYKTVACDYEAETGEHRFVTVLTTPKALHDLIVDRAPQRVVIEICSMAGWVADLVRSLDVELEVANTADERWRKVKPKNDRRDALKAAQLSAVNQLCPVHVPELQMRQWRPLIGYRAKLVQRRTKIKTRPGFIEVDRAARFHSLLITHHCDSLPPLRPTSCWVRFSFKRAPVEKAIQ